MASRPGTSLLARMIRLAGWTSEHSVDGQLEELVDLFNTSFLSGSPGCMRYQRGRMPVSGELVCQAVHSDDANPVHKMLRERFSWADGRPLAAEYVVFLRFLQRTFVQWRGCGHRLTVLLRLLMA